MHSYTHYMPDKTDTTIMLIDDDPVVNLINQKLLINARPETVISDFQFAPEALDYLCSSQEELPDKIFLDINMPVMNGWDFLEKFEEMNFSTEVYVLSSSNDHSDVQRSKAFKTVKEYIVKPLSLEKIEEILD